MKKRAIIQSLEEMDDSKADRLMKFINTMFWDSLKNPTRQQLKQKAMKQIQKALQKHASQVPYRA